MKQHIKNNYKFIIAIIIILILFLIKFPYYINAPGGISNMSDKIQIDGYQSKGSFNIVYVKEYRATIPTLLISLFNKDWHVYSKSEILLNNEDDDSYSLRDKLFMQESISNAIYVAYTNANSNISITNNYIYIAYVDELANTNLKVGDIIISINDKIIKSKDDITEIINKLDYNDILKIKVINNNKEKERYAYIINENNNKKIGVVLSNINEYDTEPKVNVKISSNESGSSGGLITALSIYNYLTEEDITGGLKIVGTGTIDLDGNVGSIGGVEYKLKSAVKNNADIFIVPIGENYDDAIKIKQQNGYNIKILGVNTFDEVLKYFEKVN